MHGYWVNTCRKPTLGKVEEELLCLHHPLSSHVRPWRGGEGRSCVQRRDSLEYERLEELLFLPTRLWCQIRPEDNLERRVGGGKHESQTH